MKSFAAVTLALALAAGPTPSAPAQIIIQTRPDQVGDRYSYTSKTSGHDSDGRELHDLDAFTIEVLEVKADGLRLATIRPGGSTTPDGPGVIPDALYEGAAPSARLETERPAITAAHWTDWDLTRIGVLQYRGPFRLGIKIDPPVDFADGLMLQRTTEIRDYDAATCQVRVIHLQDFYNTAGNHHTFRSEEVISTRDGWTIRYEFVETNVGGSTGTLTILRDGPAPGC